MTDNAELRRERESRRQQLELLLKQLEVTARMLEAYYQTLGTEG